MTINQSIEKFTLRSPASLFEEMREAAESQHISINSYLLQAAELKLKADKLVKEKLEKAILNTEI